MWRHGRVDAGIRSRVLLRLRAAMECGVLALVCLSPWGFGAVEPEFELLLYVVLALLLLLWAARLLIEGTFTLHHCPVLLCLGGLILCASLQLVPVKQPMLQWLSPKASELYRQLLPTRPELLPDGVERSRPSCLAGSTISLYPFATRMELARLMAVFLLFALVRHNLADEGGLRRLSIAVLVNGVLLSYLGLAQFFSSPPGLVYWTFQSPGRVFGPFINRNHCAFYLNLCIGLGLGCLLDCYRRSDAAGIWGAPRVRVGWGGRTPAHRGFSTGTLLSWCRAIPERVLGSSAALWISVGLAFMIAGVAFSLSRGGMVAFFGAGGVVVLLWMCRRRRLFGVELVLLVLCLALALLVWFGLEPVLSRLETLWAGEALEHSRAPLWSDVLPAAGDFWLLGSGWGTFQYLEPLYRQAPSVGIAQHAHNEYLEAVIEGGLPRLLLTVLAVGLLLRAGWQGTKMLSGQCCAGLVYGAVFAVAAAAIHSAGEFAVHVPAVAVLLTVVGAQLSAAGTAGFVRSERKAKGTAGAVGSYQLRWRGLCPALAAGLAVTLGLMLVAVGWTGAMVQQFRRAALALEDEGGVDGLEQAVEQFELATELAPEFGRLQLEAASAHLDAYQMAMERVETEPDLTDSRLAEAEERLTRQHLLPALKHYLNARDLCPLFAEPHMRLATFRDVLKRADPAGAYLDRAKRLAPFDPELWYLCGLNELLDGRQERAWRSWRRSLELSDEFLAYIVPTAAGLVSTERLLESVLPSQPQRIIQAAYTLYPQQEQSGQRRPFLERSLKLLEAVPADSLQAEQLRLRAVIHRKLGQLRAARRDYERALLLEPGQVPWRYELAELLYQQGLVDDSHRQLVTLLRQQPGYAPATRLYQVVSRMRAEKR